MTGSPYQQEEKAVIDAVLNLFGVSKTDSFVIPIPGTTPIVYIAAGEKKQVMDLIDISMGDKSDEADAIRLQTENVNLSKEVERLREEVEGLRRDAELGKAVNRAASELPEDYEICIEIERNAGSARLFAPPLGDDDTGLMRNDFGGNGSFADEINAAIDAAIDRAKGEKE